MPSPPAASLSLPYNWRWSPTARSVIAGQTFRDIQILLSCRFLYVSMWVIDSHMLVIVNQSLTCVSDWLTYMSACKSMTYICEWYVSNMWSIYKLITCMYKPPVCEFELSAVCIWYLFCLTFEKHVLEFDRYLQHVIISRKSFPSVGTSSGEPFCGRKRKEKWLAYTPRVRFIPWCRRAYVSE